MITFQNEEIKSISGILWANAPSSIALFPNFLSSSASPIVAPVTMCVSVSIANVLITNKAG